MVALRECDSTGPVLIPVDRPRSAGGGYGHWLYVDAALPLPAMVAGRLTESLWTATVVALLYRYTRQSPLSFAMTTFAGNQASRTRIEVAICDDERIVDLADRLARMQEQPAMVDVASNVLISAGAAFPEVTDSQCELHVHWQGISDGAVVRLGYRPLLMDTTTAHRMMDSLRAAWCGTVSQPHVRVAELPLMEGRQRAQMRELQGERHVAWSGGAIHERFLTAVKRHPEAIVATGAARAITYAELDRDSRRLAQYLREHGVRCDVPVGVCIRPSVDLMIALMAVLRAGGIYMPLDPGHPPALLDLMLSEANPPVVLTHASLGELPIARARRFDLDTGLASLSDVSDGPLSACAEADDGAYLIYTSGTTGKPKGVIATHGNLLHYLLAAHERFRWQQDDVFCSIARPTFSISLFDILSPIVVGARVHFVTREEVMALESLCKTLQTVTVTHMGPGLLGSLFRHAQAHSLAFPNIRHASTGGDLVPPSVMGDMQILFPDAELHVIYGCTEIACMGTSYRIERGRSVHCNLVGKPFSSVSVQVLDEQLNVVPFGVIGEICFSGAGIARGYLDRETSTAQRFVELQGQRVYRTGDLGRLHSDGNLEILGRNDFQVQLRGMRIEPSGIENLVRSLRLSDECVVVLKHVGDNDDRLVAYVTGPRADVGSLRTTIAAHLPDYMVPQHVIPLDALPMTMNGKIDRRKLTMMPLQVANQVHEPVSFATDVERSVAEAFATALGVSQVGPEDDFFALGGHSLLAVVAIRDISARLGMSVPAHVLFQSGTPRDVARCLQGRDRHEVTPILLNRPVAGPGLFMVGGAHVYRELSRQLDGVCKAYGVFTEQEADRQSSDTFSVLRLASDYLALIRREQPRGPYCLLGFSFAGIVAYEVAQQLHAAGERVAYLALVDSMLPEWHQGWSFRLKQIRRAFGVSPSLLFDYLIWRMRTRRAVGTMAEADRLRIRGTNLHIRPQDRPLVDPLQSLRDEINERAAKEYLRSHIRPYPQKIGLIMSLPRLREDPLKSRTGGWSEYVPEFDICNVEADHMQILESRPHVTTVARFIHQGIRDSTSPAVQDA